MIKLDEPIKKETLDFFQNRMFETIDRVVKHLEEDHKGKPLTGIRSGDYQSMCVLLDRIRKDMLSDY